MERERTNVLNTLSKANKSSTKLMLEEMDLNIKTLKDQIVASEKQEKPKIDFDGMINEYAHPLSAQIQAKTDKFMQKYDRNKEHQID